MQLLTIILRSVQLLFSIVVLGLAVSLAKEQYYGSVPLTNYAGFTGGFGIIVAILGIAACWFEVLAGLVMMVVDALASLFFLAGGIAVAVKLKGVSCSSNSLQNQSNLMNNSLINGGTSRSNNGDVILRPPWLGNWDKLRSRCSQNAAESAFMFLALIMSAVCIVMAFLNKRRGKSGSGMVV